MADGLLELPEESVKRRNDQDLTPVALLAGGSYHHWPQWSYMVVVARPGLVLTARL